MAIVGAISSPIVQHSGSASQSVAAAQTADLARTTQNINHAARVTPTPNANAIQQTSRAPRTTPADVAQGTTKESNDAHFTPPEDRVTISENARLARSPEPVQTGENVGNLNVGNNLIVKA